MYLSSYEIKYENSPRIYYKGNGHYDDLDYSGYQNRGNGHGIYKNYRLGNGDVCSTDFNHNMIYGIQ